jgi:hypothetical protein
VVYIYRQSDSLLGNYVGRTCKLGGRVSAVTVSERDSLCAGIVLHEPAEAEPSDHRVSGRPESEAEALSLEGERRGDSGEDPASTPSLRAGGGCGAWKELLVQIWLSQ